MRYICVVGPGAEIAKRFRLERQLGSGGMGSVWAATHLVTQKSVALKFLHEKRDDEAARRRMLREARAACAVQHPNVVAVHDVIEGEDGTPILVMDLLRGESLAGKLAREKTLSAVDAAAVVRPILSALAAAHAAGIVHRDLKPDNVFLVDGACSNVRILDFGVAKLSGKDAATKETNRLTETGAMIGTPHYMAPEQAFGESDIDARADLWAVGAVLYECLAGVPPTDGHNLGQILKVLASGKIVPLASRAPLVPAALAALVDDLLAIEKEARPRSAEEVLARLEALDTNAATPHGSASSAPDAPMPARSETLELAGQALPAVPTTTATRRTGRTSLWIAGAVTAGALVAAAGGVGMRLRAPAVQEAAQVSESAVASAPSSASARLVEPSSIAPAVDVPESPAAPAPVAAVPVKNHVKPRATKAPLPRPSEAATSADAKSSSGPLIAEPTF